MRRKYLSYVVFLFIFICETGNAWASEKKGVAIGVAVDPTGSKVSSLNVGWYYNWTLLSSGSNSHCFVPMFWGKHGQLDRKFNRAQKGAKPRELLVYNEPDFVNQSNRSVDEVVDEWPLISTMADRISSPTPARPFGKWMENFMSMARKKQLKIDFLAVHWYGGPNSVRFLEFIDKLYFKYKMPIWITEFAVADWKSTKYGLPNRYSETEVIRFMEKVLPELERRPYVERYAWLGASTEKESLRSSLLFDAQGQITQVGRAYSHLESSHNCKDRSLLTHKP